MKKADKRLTIEEHPIYSKLLDNELNVIAREFLNAKEENRTPLLTKKETKIKKLFDFSQEIENKLVDINLSKHFLKTHASLGKKVKDNFAKSVYIKYHLEFYKISVVAVFDRILHLVNYVYNLGLCDKFVQKDIICSNTNTPKLLIKVISDFDKSIQLIRFDQNKAKHKEKTYLPDIYNAELLEFSLKQWKEVKRLKVKVGYSWTADDEKNLKGDSDFGYDIFLSKQQKEIDLVNKTLLKYVTDILDIVYPEFISKL